MRPLVVDTRAPGRGQYDRRLSLPERLEGERTRLMLTAKALLEHTDTLTVQKLVDEAGVSRSTFYRHFNGVAALLLAVSQESEQALIQSLQARVDRERTPAARWRAMVLTFFAWLEEQPFALNLVHATGGLLGEAEATPFGRALQKAIRHCLEATARDMRIPVNVTEFRLRMGLSVFAALLHERNRGQPDLGLAFESAALQEEVFAVLLRLFH